MLLPSAARRTRSTSHQPTTDRTTRRLHVEPVRPNYASDPPKLGWRIGQRPDHHEVLIPCLGRAFSPYRLTFDVDGAAVHGRRLFLRPVGDQILLGDRSATLVRTMSWEPLGRVYRPRRMLRAFLLVLLIAIPVAIVSGSIGVVGGVAAAAAISGSGRRVKAAFELQVDGTSAGTWTSLATSVQGLSSVDFTYDTSPDAIARSWAAEDARAAARRDRESRRPGDFDVAGLDGLRSFVRAGGVLIARWTLDDAQLTTLFAAAVRWPPGRTVQIAPKDRRSFSIEVRIEADAGRRAVVARIPYGKGRHALKAVGWATQPSGEYGTRYHTRRFEVGPAIDDLGARVAEAIREAFWTVYGARFDGVPWAVGAT